MSVYSRHVLIPARAVPCTSRSLHEPCPARALPCTSRALHEPCPVTAVGKRWRMYCVGFRRRWN